MFRAPIRSAARRHTSVVRLLAVLLAVTGLMVATTGCDPSTMANENTQLVNGARSARGIHRLARHAQLDRKAQAWAEHMAAQGRISHSVVSSGAPGGWSTLAENVAMGTSVADAHRRLMGSTPHRANILAGRFTHIGVGAASRNGVVFIVEVYMG